VKFKAQVIRDEPGSRHSEMIELSQEYVPKLNALRLVLNVQYEPYFLVKALPKGETLSV
jgi:hypothetical protein